MDLRFQAEIADGYHSKSQSARVLTENWVLQNMFCPRCGNLRMEHFTNNRPVADFFCPRCATQYELKSKAGKIGDKVSDGTYQTMIDRITSCDNPDFFFMRYSMSELCVKDFVLVLKHCLTPGMIEKRKPLSPTARRAGWVGCNILLSEVPEQGRITIIQDGHVKDMDSVIKEVETAQRLNDDNLRNRGWMLDVLNCINSIQFSEFELSDVYRFESVLAKKHPQNNNICPKIRQQLQVLRDRGFIEFVGRGKYRKCV